MRARDWTVPLSLLSLVASTALAADELGEAKQHVENGRQLYKEARYKEAVSEYELAISLSIKAKPEGAGVVYYNLGQAYEKLGDVGAAVKAYKEYLRLTPAAKDRAAVQTVVANLETRLARGVQELSVSSDPNGSNVAVDGKLRAATPVTMELPYGSHQLEVTHDGYEPATRTVDLTPQATVKLDIALAKKPPPPPVAEKPRIWTWVALGAGVVAAGTAAYFGSQAVQNANQLKAQMHSSPVPDQLYDASVTDQVVSNVLWGTAGAAAIAGGALFFVEGKF